MKLLLIILLLISCGGCQVTGRDMAYHTLNGLNVYQAQRFDDNPCTNPLIFGEEHTERELILFYVATSLGYQLLASNYRDTKFFKILETVGLIGTAANLGYNEAEYNSKGC